MRLGSPPFVLGGQDVRRAPAGIQGVDVRNNDITDGLFRAADVPQVGDVSRIIRGFQLLPGEELATHDNIRPDLAATTLSCTGGITGDTSGTVAERDQPGDSQDEVDAERNQSNNAPAHIVMYLQKHASANLKMQTGKSC